LISGSSAASQYRLRAHRVNLYAQNYCTGFSKNGEFGGRVDADLTGDRKKDLEADISGGVGAATIRLPKNVGVVAEVSGGLGSIDTHGLKKDGDQYVNDSYGHTPATIHLHISGGIGSISLTQEP
jgi:hypothetical protein